jgi:hypothetical protein
MHTSQQHLLLLMPHYNTASRVEQPDSTSVHFVLPASLLLAALAPAAQQQHPEPPPQQQQSSPSEYG